MQFELFPTMKAPAVPARAPSCLWNMATLRDQRSTLMSRLTAALGEAPDELVVSPQGVAETEALDLAGESPMNVDEILRLAVTYTAYRRSAVKGLIQTDFAALRSDIMAGILSRFGEHVDLEMPGGGSFRILNSKRRLRVFLARVDRGFLRCNSTADGSPRGKPTQISACAKTVGSAQVEKAGALSVASEDTANDGALCLVVQAGPHTVATDKQRMTVLFGGASMPIDEVPLYPARWRAQAEAHVALRDDGFSPGAGLIAKGSATTETLMREIIRAKQIFGHGETPTVSLHWVDGRVEVSSSTDRYNDMEYRNADLPEDHAPLCRLNADHALDALRAARMVGCQSVDVWATKNGSLTVPVFAYADRGFTIVMPMR